MNEIRIKNNNTYLIINSPKHGEFKILIDKEDINKLNKYKWSIQMVRSVTDKDYVAFYATSGTVGFLHRFVVNCPKGMVVDHINGNTLDNRKSNLRICTHKQNSENRKLHKRNKNGCTGIFYDIGRGNNPTPKWIAHICIDGKRKHLGRFNTKEEAVECRIKAEDKYYGEFSRNINNVGV